MAAEVAMRTNAQPSNQTTTSWHTLLGTPCRILYDSIHNLFRTEANRAINIREVPDIKGNGVPRSDLSARKQ